MTRARGSAALLAAVLLGWALIGPVSIARAEAPARVAWTRRAAEAWVARARASLERGDTASAITAYTEAIRSDPTFGEAYLALARIRSALGDVAQCEWLLGRAAGFQDTRAAALVQRSRLYLTTGRAELALADLRAAVDAEASPDILRELGAFYLGRRAWVAALTVYRRLAMTLPSDANPDQRQEVETTLGALVALAAEADPVRHAMRERGWIRPALRRQAARRLAQRARPEATRGASAAGFELEPSERKLAP